MHKGVKVTLVGGVFAVMVGGAGYGAYNVVNGVTGGGGSSASGPRTVKAGPPTSGEIRGTTEKFFASWAKGDAERAGGYTNNAEVASKLLTGFREDAHLTKVKLTPGRAAGATVPFSVEATVSYKGKTKPFAYDSELTVVRGETTGRALVDWDPSVVHPDLKRDDTLETGEAAAPPIQAVDRHGTALDKKDFPSLGPVLDQLRAKYGDQVGGTPGVELYVRHADEDAGTETLLTLAKGKAGRLRTTLSASAQRAAEKAVARHAD
ncbi:NTF2-like N-terminal transpeptidase domain-containing protein, partial [Streptomyces sp. NPDC058471]